MGKRDYRHRETKKAKKEGKKITPISIMTTTPPVEVIKKEKKRERGEEEE